MSDDRIIEEMARLEGFNRVNDSAMGTVYFRGDAHHCDQNAFSLESLPDYPNSHDACQSIIDGMNDQSLHHYISLLADITNGNEDAWSVESIMATAKATPRQKCEAILRARGKWKSV